MTRTWIGDTLRFTRDFYVLGDPVASHWDSLQAIEQDSVVVRRYHKNGKLKWEALHVQEIEQYRRNYYYYKDSTFAYHETRAPENGIIIKVVEIHEFYKDSTPRIIGTKVSGKLEGSYRTFYPNGNQQCDCNYKSGERDSLQRIYHDNGQLRQLLVYKDGLLTEVNGVFDSKGNSVEKGTLINGNGTLFVYDDNDKLEKIFHYENGKVVWIENFSK
jgi:hypothetical protein